MKASLDSLEVEGVHFPATVVPPGSSKSLVLGGAGVRGIPINGTFVKFTAIGIYVDESLVSHLSPKLKGKTLEELCEEEYLFEEILRAPYEKFVRVVFLVPLNGIQFSTKVVEQIGSQGFDSTIKEKLQLQQQFLEAFKGKNFSARSSVLMSVTRGGLEVAFSHEKFPERPTAVIEDAKFGDAFLATIIWKGGVSPAAKLSMADRLSKCF